jgi:biopolymer transport protein ExbB/TolQ
VSTETTPPAKSNRKLILIIGSAVVVLLAIIAWAVSSQAIRANEEAAAKERAIAQESALAKAADEAQKVLDDKMAELKSTANDVCERRLLQDHPTYAVQSGLTVSTLEESTSTWETKGAWTEVAAGSTIPREFICNSKPNADGQTWAVRLLPQK